MDTETAVDVLDTVRDILPPLELSWSLIREIIETASKSPRNTQKTLHIVSRGIEILKALRIPFSEPPISLGQFMDAMESLRKLERLLLETKEIVEKEAKIPLTYSDDSKKTWGMRRDALLKLLKEANAPEFEPPEGWEDDVDEVTRVDDHLWVSLIAHDMWNFGNDLGAAQDAENLSATLLEPEEPQGEGEESSSPKQQIDDIMTTWEEVRQGAQQSSSPLLQRIGSFMVCKGILGHAREAAAELPHRVEVPAGGLHLVEVPAGGLHRVKVPPGALHRVEAPPADLPHCVKGPTAPPDRVKAPASLLDRVKSPNKPAASTQGSNKPAASAQATNKPAASTQGTNRPAASTQGSNRPAASTQGTKKPAASTQGTNRPAATAQGTNRPAASTQASNKPAASTQATNKPAASTPASNKPAASTQGSSKPAPSTQGKFPRGSLFQSAFKRFAPKEVQMGDVTLSDDPKKGVKVGLSPDAEDSVAQLGKSGAAKATAAATATAAAAGYELSSNPGDQEATAEDTGDNPQAAGDEPPDAGDEDLQNAGDEEFQDAGEGELQDEGEGEIQDEGEGETQDAGDGEDTVDEAAEEQPINALSNNPFIDGYVTPGLAPMSRIWKYILLIVIAAPTLKPTHPYTTQSDTTAEFSRWAIY
ncbi:hypothetical protein FRC04_006152 [Tulasnella sp. 424]|nr:hypothetical protein FRC04_006152 [Tulasnella sp. 424]